MFMIHSPQTMQLLADDPSKKTSGEVHGAVTFDHEGEDVSKCRMIIASNDRVWTYTFNTRGLLVDSAYEDDASRKAKAEAEKKAKADSDAAEKARIAAEQQAAKESADHELKTMDDTTAKDVAWDSPGAHTQPEPFMSPPPAPAPSDPFGQNAVNTTRTLNDPHRTMENQHG